MKLRLATSIIIASLVAVSASAMPVGYDFYQGGYTGGAFLHGHFVGEDLDGNGQLSSFSGEISGFALSFNGQGGLASFVFGLDDLFGLVYDLDGGLLGDGLSRHIEGLLAFDGNSLLAVGPGPLWRTCGGGYACAVAASGHKRFYSGEGIQVMARGVAVPEPGSVGLIVLGLIGLVLVRRKIGAQQ